MKETIKEFVNDPEFVIVHTRSDEEKCLIKNIIVRIGFNNKGWQYSIRKMIKYNTIEIGLFNKYGDLHIYYVVRCNSIGFCNFKKYRYGTVTELSRSERKRITPDVVELYDLLFNQSDYVLK
jgi:hypothetical protein